MCNIFSGGSVDTQAADAARAAENKRQADIKSGMGEIDKAFAGFDDNFYNQRAKDYEAYAKPQLDTQYEDAKKTLIYALSRSGNLSSSLAAEKNAKLLEDYNNYNQDIVNQGNTLANQLRGDVNSNRSSLTSELNLTANPAAAAKAAAERATSLSAPGSFSALGSLFSNVTDNLANYTSNANNGYAGLSPLIFGGGKSGVKIVQ